MSNNKTDISQIRKYLNGELDARAMHQLEREAQDDPFLMDALEGFESTATDQQADLNDLQQRLAKRVEPKKERSIILWRVLPLAASLLMAISIGYWFLQSDKPTVKKYTQVVLLPPKANAGKAASRKDTALDEDRVASAPATAVRKNQVVLQQHAPRITPHQDAQIASALAGRAAGVAVKLKEDTTEYKASAYPVHANALTEELLKKLPGINVDSNGNVTAEGKQVKKVRINGKDFFGGDVAQATKNLPADVISKIQVIDDYGDQANLTGVKSGEPNKILNITTKKDSALLAQNRRFGNDKALGEVTIKGAASPQKRETTQALGSISARRPDTVTNAFAKRAVKAKSTATDSSSTLGEVVVPGYADKPADNQAQPLHGWKAYLAYIKQMAVMPDGSIGKVKLAFRVDTNGSIYGVRIIRGKTLAMNERAIDIIKSGPAWIGERRSKEVRLKIKFHKKA